MLAGCCPRAAAVLEEAEPDALAYLDFPPTHWKRLRTNNVQERTNREICYRQWKIGQLRYCKLPNGVTPVYPTSTTPSQPSYGSLLLSVGTSLSL